MRATVGNAGSRGLSIARTLGGEQTEHQQVISVLQAEIDMHKQQIIEKTRLMNSFAPINRLPSELLAEILLYWADAVKVLSLTRQRTWVARVCHHWREVALSSPRIWSNFALGSLDWTKEMLARSKRAPLRIAALSSNCLQRAEAFKLALHELPRIESLEIHSMEDWDMLDEVQLGTNAPLLRSLIVYGGGGSPYYTQDVHHSIVTSFENIDMPRLTRLELKDSAVLWSSLLLKPTLTCLVFRGTSTRYRNTDFADILRVLRGMPLLQTLDLAGVLPTLPSDDPALPDLDYYVSLPALHTMSISAAARSCAFLLQHINVSVTSLQMDCRTTSPAEIKILAPIVASKLRGSSSTESMVPFRSVHFSRNSISAWDEVRSLETLMTSHYYGVKELEPRLRLSLSGMLSDDILEILAVLPLEEVQACAINGLGITSQGWQKLFEAMPNVRELAACEPSQALAEVLGKHFSVARARKQSKSRKSKQEKLDVMLLPKLKVLLLTLVRFFDHIDQPEEQSAFWIYRNMLETRKKARKQVKTLIIRSGINFNDTHGKLLERCVEEVEWDGIEDYSEGEDEDEDDYSDEDNFFGLPVYYDDDFEYSW